MLGAWLERQGLRGEALLLFPAGFDFLSAFFGCLYAGVVAIPASMPRNQRGVPQAVAIAADSGAKVILGVGSTFERARSLLEGSLKQELQWLDLASLDHESADDWRPGRSMRMVRLICNTRRVRPRRPGES